MLRLLLFLLHFLIRAYLLLQLRQLLYHIECQFLTIKWIFLHINQMLF